MTNRLNITSERVDDIPLLLAQIEGMGIPELLDTHCDPWKLGWNKPWVDGRRMDGAYLVA